MAKAELYSKESVINYYENSPHTMFRVFAGYTPTPTGCRYEYLGTDKNEGTGIITEALDAIEKNTLNTNTYCLQLIKDIETKVVKRGEITKEIPAVCIAFQINLPYGVGVEKTTIGNTPVTIYNPAQPNAGGNDYATKLFEMMQKQNEKLLEQIEMLNERIEQKAIAGADDDDEDDETAPEPPKSGADMLLGAISGILENDQVKNAAAAIIMGIASKYLPKE